MSLTKVSYSMIQGAPINVLDYGADNTGSSNSTTAINAAIQATPAYGTVYLPPGTYNINTLTLKNNITFYCEGLLNQITAASIETYSGANQDSDYPAIDCSTFSNVTITARVKTNYEAVKALNCNRIIIKDSYFEGYTTNTFAAVITYLSNNVNIYNTTVTTFGPVRATTAYGPNCGGGLRLLGGQFYKVTDCIIIATANNGIFTEEVRNIEIRGNQIKNNALSGIQIAFNGSFTARDIVIDANDIFGNNADAIDINNGAYTTFNIHCTISNNRTLNNGFVGGLGTVDGAGICTLINVSGVTITTNYSELSNKGSVNCFGDTSCNIYDNYFDNAVTIQNSSGSVNVSNTTLTNITVITSTVLAKLSVINNKLQSIGLPNGITITELWIDNNIFSAAVLNINLTGTVNIVNNSITTSSGNETALVVAATRGLNISNNIISHTSSTSDCISIAATVASITIASNEIISKNAAISDAGSAYILIENNYIESVSGGFAGPFCYSGTPNNAMLRGNTFNSTSRSISITSGTLFLERNQTIAGTTSFGSATVQSATYA